MRDLVEDPEAAANAPNQVARNVRSGHFVRVRPTPLPEPYLVLASAEACALLALTECNSSRFVRAFSGGGSDLRGFNETWATPYSLSIYGQEPMLQQYFIS